MSPRQRLVQQSLRLELANLRVARSVLLPTSNELHVRSAGGAA